MRSEDLELVVVVATGGVASRLEATEGSVLEPHLHLRGIIDIDGIHIGATQPDRPLVNEGLGLAGDRRDRPDEIMGKVDAVGVEIAVRSGAGELLLHLPAHRRGGIDQALLQVGTAPVSNLSKSALVDDSSG